MTDPDTLRRLELPRVLELVAERTAFGPSRELAVALRPTADAREALRLQDETEAARRALADRPSLSIGGARDIRDALRRAALGGVLDARALLEVAATIRAAAQLFSAIDDPRYAALHARARFARAPLAVADAVEHAIAPTGEVLDRASLMLGSIRAELKAALARLQQRADAFVRSPESARFLQEPLVSQRGGRYVVPVKSEHRAQVRGIVHDQSASGQTLFIEPLEMVDLGNRLRESQLAEEREVERILAELSGSVAREGEDLARTLDAVAAIDLLLAKAHLAEAMEATRPALASDASVDLVDARHPLLVEVVPISVRLGAEFEALVITGPNTGGKTVSLKTLGLLCLMAACGLQLPAGARSRVPVFRRVFADIGDEQSIQQSLSTFSSHMRNVVATLREAQAGDLALLDEIGAGTDPDEGAALAMAILTTLLARGVLVAATTHYPELKAFALATEGVRNANVEFDVDTLRPTYRLRIGLPGASQAFAIAGRLGLDEAVLTEAGTHLSELHRTLDQTLRQAERQRVELAEAIERTEAERARAEDERRAAEAERRGVLAEAQAALERARREAEEVLLQARRALRAAESARAQHTRRNLVEEARAALADSERVLSDRATAAPAVEASEVDVGSAVFVRDSRVPGRLLRVDERGLAEVEAGSLRMRVPLADLRPAPAAAEEPPRPERPGRSATAVPAQLDLRGARAEEALQILDRYLNDAALAGVDRLRIVHGKGTGALRTAVRAALSSHPLVRASRPAPANEGGDGATMVEL